MPKRELAYIDGGPELRAAFDRMSNEVKGQGLLDLVEVGGDVLEPEVKTRVPRGESGRLIGGIRSYSGLPKPDRAFSATGPKAVAYGSFVELGTKNMAAQPYLRPALIAARQRIVAAMAARLKAILEAVRG